MKGSKLIILFKTFLFIGLIMMIGDVYAEFYLVYSMPPTSDCYHYRPRHAFKRFHHRMYSRRVHHPHRHYGRAYYRQKHVASGLYILFPVPGPMPCPDMWPLGSCGDYCCTTATWQPGSYAVYTLPPDGIRSTYIPDGKDMSRDPTIDMDGSTADDVSFHRDMYIN